VVSFGRANFRLSEESVGIALEAAIGGYCGHLKVSLLRERVYSFVVSSEQVGFEIIKKRFILANNLNATSIFGGLVVLIGHVSLDFGRMNAMRSGLWSVRLRSI
jgi:hypothetical protein